MGILAMLLHCARLGCLSPPSCALVDATLRRLLALRFADGNVPTALGRGESDGLVHWCHGAPGLPALLASALGFGGGGVSSGSSSSSGSLAQACTVPREALLAAARAAADVVWTRGLLTKGYGLCHGVCGNGYAFLTLHRLTGEEAQLGRAFAFATLLGDEGFARVVAETDDPQRKVRGLPDSPQSLMEGDAGVCATCWIWRAWRTEARRPSQDGSFSK